jgi:peptidoglycan/LPS O-acetylase OafA/YrhL
VKHTADMGNRINLEIEALRGISIIFVLLAHFPAIAPWAPWPLLRSLESSFGAGVDLFFCISGFVISRVLVREFSRTRPWRTLGAFWIKRAFRLLPTAYCWVAITLLLTAFFNKSGIFGSLSSAFEQAIAIALYAYNFLVIRYLENGTPIAAFGPFFSLSIEEQFYLAFPICMLILKKHWIIVAMVFLFAIQIFVTDGVYAYVRTNSIAIGVLIFLFSETRTYLRIEPSAITGKARSATVNIAAAALLLWAGSTRYFSVMATTSGILVFLASYDRGHGPSFPILRPALLWFGTRSYAIYIVHLPLIRANNEIWWRIAESFNQPQHVLPLWPIVASAGALVLIAAEINFHLLERPLRNYGRALAHNLTSDEMASHGGGVNKAVASL